MIIRTLITILSLLICWKVYKFAEPYIRTLDILFSKSQDVGDFLEGMETKPKRKH